MTNVGATPGAESGQNPPAIDRPKEEKKSGPKKSERNEKNEKSEKTDKREDTKSAALVKVNVEVRANGTPVGEALVLVMQPGGFERNSSTNSAGMAHFSQVPRGKTTVQVTALGFKPHSTEEDFAGQEVNLTVALSKQ